MNARARALAIFAVIFLGTFGVVVLAVNATPELGRVQVAGVQATPAPPTTAELLAPSTLQPTATTGIGPESFTTNTVPGPVQVLVHASRCAGYAGAGWKVSWEVRNTGDRPLRGPLVARVDDGPLWTIAPSLELAAGRELAQETVIQGSGDAVVITWAPAGRPAVSSFPWDLGTCKTNPADDRAARQTTTTT